MKENPVLALDNSATFCIVHHRVADSVRHVTEEALSERLTAEHLKNVLGTMPEDMRKALVRVLNAALALNL